MDLHAMDQDDVIMNTPRSNARRTKRNARMLDSPERRKTPQAPQLPFIQPFQQPAFPAPPIGPIQFNDPFQNNFALPPAVVQPQNNHPAPAYRHLPAHLAQAVAQLPPLQPVGRVHGHPRRQMDPPALPPVPSLPMVRVYFGDI